MGWDTIRPLETARKCRSDDKRAFHACGVHWAIESYCDGGVGGRPLSRGRGADDNRGGVGIRKIFQRTSNIEPAIAYEFPAQPGGLIHRTEERCFQGIHAKIGFDAEKKRGCADHMWAGLARSGAGLIASPADRWEQPIARPRGAALIYLAPPRVRGCLVRGRLHREESHILPIPRLSSCLGGVEFVASR